MSKVSIIVAIGRNREIGAKNQLLWKIPEELRRFKEITTGHPIIMGRKTHESIGRVLPGRTNIIVTRDTRYEIREEGAIVVHSLEEALEKAQDADGSEEVFIIGGAQIFAEALPTADKLYVTLVDRTFRRQILSSRNTKLGLKRSFLRSSRSLPDLSIVF